MTVRGPQLTLPACLGIWSYHTTVHYVARSCTIASTLLKWKMDEHCLAWSWRNQKTSSIRALQWSVGGTSTWGSAKMICSARFKCHYICNHDSYVMTFALMVAYVITFAIEERMTCLFGLGLDCTRNPVTGIHMVTVLMCPSKR